MSLVKRSDLPSLMGNSWLSDFFDSDRFFDSSWMKTASVPAVNIKENKQDFEIDVAAPGLNKKDFQISAENGILTISSEKEEEKEEEKENGYTRQEFSYSSFSRSFTLPKNANEDDIKANYEDGVLKLHIAKKSISEPRAKKAIEVK